MAARAGMTTITMIKYPNIKYNTHTQILIRIKLVNVYKVFRTEPDKGLTVHMCLSKIYK